MIGVELKNVPQFCQCIGVDFIRVTPGCQSEMILSRFLRHAKFHFLVGVVSVFGFEQDMTEQREKSTAVLLLDFIASRILCDGAFHNLSVFENQNFVERFAGLTEGFSLREDGVRTPKSQNGKKE